MLRKIAADYETGTTPAPGEDDDWVPVPNDQGGIGHVRGYEYTSDDMLDNESYEATKRVAQYATDPKIRQRAQAALLRSEAAAKIGGIEPGSGTWHKIWGDQYLNPPPQQTASNPPAMSPEEAFGPRPSHVEHAPYNPQQPAQAQAPAAPPPPPAQRPAPSIPATKPRLADVAARPSSAQKTTAYRPGMAEAAPNVRRGAVPYKPGVANANFIGNPAPRTSSVPRGPDVTNYGIGAEGNALFNFGNFIGQALGLPTRKEEVMRNAQPITHQEYMDAVNKLPQHVARKIKINH